MKLRVSIVILLFTLIFAPLARAAIIEEAKMAEAISYADKDTLLIFDLDNTIMEPAQMLGSVQWYYYLIKKYIDQGMEKKEAADKVTSTWIRIQEVTQMQPVESATPSLIKKAQEGGIKAMALTARPTTLAKTTIKQLQSIGVDFTRQPACKKDLSSSPRHKDSGYIGGVLFAGLENDKGDVLNEFLKDIKYKPTEVVFIDDDQKNVEAVDKALAAKGIKCSCVRYGGADQQVKAFDPNMADIELDFFGKILTDRAARAIAKSHIRLPQ